MGQTGTATLLAHTDQFMAALEPTWVELKLIMWICGLFFWSLHCFLMVMTDWAASLPWVHESCVRQARERGRGCEQGHTILWSLPWELGGWAADSSEWGWFYEREGEGS